MELFQRAVTQPQFKISSRVYITMFLQDHKHPITVLKVELPAIPPPITLVAPQLQVREKKILIRDLLHVHQRCLTQGVALPQIQVTPLKFLHVLPTLIPSRSSFVNQSRAVVLTSKDSFELLEEKEKRNNRKRKKKRKGKLSERREDRNENRK